MRLEVGRVIMLGVITLVVVTDLDDASDEVPDDDDVEEDDGVEVVDDVEVESSSVADGAPLPSSDDVFFLAISVIKVSIVIMIIVMIYSCIFLFLPSRHFSHFIFLGITFSDRRYSTALASVSVIFSNLSRVFLFF
eukprot:TRINITY_DN4812_c0_g1_i3.p1 TRINITY_DN4812_c0_g1~~TRINITY_DN4812_c0_g1_i3.p1  ORF type:complete len:136 (-),score=21.46 TRINITY_DN4812_c0_g1_i3:46-453(-)